MPAKAKIRDEQKKRTGPKKAKGPGPQIPNGPLPEAWKHEIIQIVQAELKTAMESLQAIPESPKQGLELAPAPPERIMGEYGKKVNPGKRVKIAGTADAELVRLLEQWRQEKGITLSRALDAALWHFLGKPKLSFEIPEGAEIERES